MMNASYLKYVFEVALIVVSLQFLIGYFDVLGASSAIDANTDRVTMNTFGPLYGELMPGPRDGSVRDEIVIILIDDNDLFGECGNLGIRPWMNLAANGSVPQCKYGPMGGPRPIGSNEYDSLLAAISDMSPDGVFLDLVFPGDQEDLIQSSARWVNRHGIAGLRDLAPAPGTTNWDTGIIAGSAAEAISADVMQRRAITIYPDENAIALGQVLTAREVERKWNLQRYYSSPDTPPAPEHDLFDEAAVDAIETERTRERLSAAAQLFLWKCALEQSRNSGAGTDIFIRFPGCKSAARFEDTTTQALRTADAQADQPGAAPYAPMMSLVWARAPLPTGGTAPCPRIFARSLWQNLRQSAAYFWASAFSSGDTRQPVVCDYFLTLSVSELWNVWGGNHETITREHLKNRVFLIGADFSPFHDRHQIHEIRRHGTQFHAMALDNLLRLGADFKVPQPNSWIGIKGSPAALLDVVLILFLLLFRFPYNFWKAPYCAWRCCGCYDLMVRSVQQREQWLSMHKTGLLRTRSSRVAIRIASILAASALLLMIGITISMIAYRLTWGIIGWAGFNWIGTAGLFTAAGMQGYLNISQQLLPNKSATV